MRPLRRLRASLQLALLGAGLGLPVRQLRESQHGRDERALPEQLLRSPRAGWPRFRVAGCDAGAALKFDGSTTSERLRTTRIHLIHIS